MATASTLAQAARQAWDNLQSLAVTNTLKAQVLAFTAAIKPAFADQAVLANHSITNWISVLEAQATIASATGGWPVLRILAELVYRLCFQGDSVSTGGTNQFTITPAQATLILTQYNAKF
jgi:hypothetical protein